MADDLDQLEADLALIEVAMRHVDAGDMEAFAAATVDLRQDIGEPAESGPAETTEPSPQPSAPFAKR